MKNLDFFFRSTWPHAVCKFESASPEFFDETQKPQGEKEDFPVKLIRSVCKKVCRFFVKVRYFSSPAVPEFSRNFPQLQLFQNMIAIACCGVVIFLPKFLHPVSVPKCLVCLVVSIAVYSPFSARAPRVQVISAYGR